MVRFRDHRRMIVNLDTRRLRTLDDIRAFLSGSTQFELFISDRTAAYRWIEDTLKQLRYGALGKADRGTVRTYVMTHRNLHRSCC
jgi:hypothetical protein